MLLLFHKPWCGLFAFRVDSSATAVARNDKQTIRFLFFFQFFLPETT